MARIVNLDDYVPEDVDFTYRGSNYILPGDVDVDQTFELLSLFIEAEDAQAGDLKRKHAYNKKVQATLLKLFQVRQPELENLPFGQMALSVVLRETLVVLGLIVVEPDPPVPPAPAPTPKPKRPTRPAASPRRKR
jgi:hypothetical protein